MNWTAWIPLAGVVTAALITSTAALRVANRSRTRFGDWQAIKTDLEIAQLLDETDPMRDWLRTYADVRLRALGEAETGTNRVVGWMMPGQRIERVAFGMTCLVITFFYVFMFAMLWSEDGFWGQPRPSTVGAALIIALMTIGLVAAALIIRNTKSKVFRGKLHFQPGLSDSTETAFAIAALNNQIRDAEFKRRGRGAR